MGGTQKLCALKLICTFLLMTWVIQLGNTSIVYFMIHVLLSSSKEGLQHSYLKYLKKWSLRVNLN